MGWFLTLIYDLLRTIFFFFFFKELVLSSSVRSRTAPGCHLVVKRGATSLNLRLFHKNFPKFRLSQYKKDIKRVNNPVPHGASQIHKSNALNVFMANVTIT